MAKFTIDDFASGKASSGPKDNSELKSYGRLGGGKIVFEDDTMRVIQRGTTWFDYIVYNYKTLPPNCGPGTDNPKTRYGASFTNQQLAERNFARMKQNLIQTVEI